MNVIVSDFDDTLFKRYHGLIYSTVSYLEQQNTPVFILTHRNENQQEFIAEQLAGTKLNIAGYGFTDSRKKDPNTKVTLMRHLLVKYNVVEALDDDPHVIAAFRRMGIRCILTGSQ